MIKSIWAGNTPYSKILITVGIILLCAVLFTLISTIVVSVLFNVTVVDLGSMLNNLESPSTLTMLKIIQTITAIGAFIVPPFILAYLFSSVPSQYLLLNRKPELSSVIVVILAMLIATPFINFLGEANAHMHLPSFMKPIEDWMKESEEQAAVLTKAFLNMGTFGDFMLNLFMIGLIPAIGEELLFRGIAQKLFIQLSKNIHLGVWIAAILFSAMHMQFYGFLPRMVLGAMLGYMAAWSGNLWLPIIGHFINNAGAVIFIYLFQNGYSSLDPDKIGTESDFVSVAISLIVTSLLFWMLYKRSRINVKIENLHV
jgi:membrane protease YdiL (CAAX protease family)